MYRFIAPVFATAILSLAACGDKKVKSYPDSTEGLEQLINDMTAAELDGDGKQAAAIAASLAPADHEGWFKAHFAPEVAARLSAELEPRLDQYGGIPKGLAAQQARGRSQIKAEKFTDAGDVEATGVQSLALKAATKPIALYSVRMTEPGKSAGFHLYNFVYADGGFRLLGKMKAVDDKPAGSPEMKALMEIRVRKAKEFLATGKLSD